MKKLGTVLLLCCALLLAAVSMVLGEELVLPAGLEQIEEEAFQGDESISAIILPDGLLSIGSRAFYDCTNLTSVEIPASVTEIGENAFGSCSSLKAFQVATESASYASARGVLFSKDRTALLAYPAGNSAASYRIPSGVEAIGEKAFSGSTHLKELYIPRSVTQIGPNCFQGTDELTASVYADSYALEYCIEHGIPYTVIESDYERYESIFDTCETISDMIVKYEDGNGFVAASNRPTAIAEVTAFLRVQEQQGKVNNITVNNSFVLFHDIQSDLYISYDPMVNNGSLAGGNSTSVTIITCEPNKTEKRDSAATSSIDTVATHIKNEMKRLGITTGEEDWDDEEVDMDSISSIFGARQVILWCGHGSDGGYLDTGNVYPNDQWEAEIINNFEKYSGHYRTAHFSIKKSHYMLLTIGPSFLMNHCKYMSNSFIWLGVCHGFESGEWQNAFHDRNVQAAVGFNNIVTQKYNDELCNTTMERMLEINPATGNYYTLDEALSYAQNKHGETDPYKTEDVFYHAKAINYGDENYRLIEKCECSISVRDEITDFIIPDAHIDIYDAEGKNVCDVVTDENGQVTVMLFEGKYTLSGKKDHCPTLNKEFRVSRFSDNETEMKLKWGFTVMGTVYDEDDKSLALTDVTIHGKQLENGFEVSVNNDAFAGPGGIVAGSYTINLPGGENEITFSKEGYKSKTITHTGTGGETIQHIIYLEKEEKYEITFNANGGTVSIAGYSIPKGTAIPVWPIATREGFEFICWNTSSNGSGESVDVGYIPESDMTIYAIWADNSNFTYTYLSKTDSYAIKKYTGKSLFVNIPNSYEGKPVTAIGEEAFREQTKIISIQIPEGITTIGGSAFRRCLSLKHVAIPDGVISIGSDAFRDCNAITEIVLPNSVTKIGDYAFYICDHLTEITIPEGVKAIYNGTFYGCSRMTHITIPDGVTSIGAKAFVDCRSLTEIDIPDTVTSIGEYAFYKCAGLQSISLPYGITTIKEYTFRACTNLTRVDLPYSLTGIGRYAFYDCYSLSDISIPYGVTGIGDHAFGYCKSLTSLDVPTSCKVLGYTTFMGSGLTCFTVPPKVTYLSEYVFCLCKALKEVTIPAAVTSIDNTSFNSCSSLEVVITEPGSTAEKYFLEKYPDIQIIYQ